MFVYLSGHNKNGGGSLTPIDTPLIIAYFYLDNAHTMVIHKLERYNNIMFRTIKTDFSYSENKIVNRLTRTKIIL